MPLAHHLAGEVGGLLDVVAGAGGHLAEHDLLGMRPRGRMAMRFSPNL